MLLAVNTAISCQCKNYLIIYCKVQIQKKLNEYLSAIHVPLSKTRLISVKKNDLITGYLPRTCHALHYLV